MLCCLCGVCLFFRVGQDHIYTVYIRYFWLGYHQIYGHIRCIYTVLANSTLLKLNIWHRAFVTRLWRLDATKSCANALVEKWPDLLCHWALILCSLRSPYSTREKNGKTSLAVVMYHGTMVVVRNGHARREGYLVPYGVWMQLCGGPLQPSSPSDCKGETKYSNVHHTSDARSPASLLNITFERSDVVVIGSRKHRMEKS